MHSHRTIFDGRQVMLRPDYELLHLRDIAPAAIAPHTHDCYEILFVGAASDMEYSMGGGGARFRVVPGDILLIDRNVTHGPVVGRNAIYDRILLWMTPDYVRALSGGEPPLWHCFEDPLRKNRPLLRLKGASSDAVKNVLAKLRASYFAGGYGSEILTRLYLTELLVFLNRVYLDAWEEASEDAAVENKTIEAVLEHIRENPADDLGLDELSERFFINKYHLSREFKKYTGYTIGRYICLQRVRKAQDLIQKNDLALTAVCELCGFRDYSSFFRAFTRHCGASPSRFSQKAKTTGL